MKLPATIGGLLVTAIAGGVSIAGEVDLSHPLHQAIVIAAALLTGLVGYFTLGSSSPSGPPASAPGSGPAIAALNAEAQANVLKTAGIPDGVDSAAVPFSGAKP